MPPKAAPAVGRPKGADAPMNQSREAHHVLHCQPAGLVSVHQLGHIAELGSEGSTGQHAAVLSS
jgi:hypothetical protein